MVVIVSTQGRRLVAVLMGGTVAFVGLAVAWRRLVGLPSFFAGILSLAIAALMVAYVVAVVLEGSIDRGRRKALSVRVEHSDVTVTASQRCGHCRRPMVMTGGVSMCAHCDQ